MAGLPVMQKSVLNLLAFYSEQSAEEKSGIYDFISILR